MSKILSDREAKLQKKLIPLNIFVCIISLIAAITLFLFPIIKIDFGKILNNPDMIEYIETKTDEQIGGDLSGTEQEGIDFKPAVAKIVRNVLSSAEGDLSINAFGAAKVAFAGGENKAQTVLDQLFFGDTALVTKLINSVADGVAALFKEPDGKAIIEDVIVSTVATSLINDLNADNVTDENIKSITEKFRGIENITDGNVAPVAEAIVAEISTVFGEGVTVSDEEKNRLTEEIQKMYDDAAAELDGGTVTMEAVISVTLSKNTDLSQFDINKIIDGMLGGNEENQEEGAVAAEAAEGEPSEERVIATDYNELLTLMGFEEESLKVKLRTGLEDMFNNKLDEIKIGDKSLRENMDYYAYIFYGWLAFIVPWVMLFLFSFFHMIAKNKRFMMWYVKLYSFLPCLVFCILPMLAPKLLPVLSPEFTESEMGKLLPTILTGVSSFTFISGICYVLLWLASIFWAFPVKRKIRKERKACKAAMKNGTYSYITIDTDETDKKGKKAKNKKGAEAPAVSSHTYGDYGSNEEFYRTNTNGDTYGSSFGDSSGDTYGSSFGDSFGDTYGDSFGDSFGGYDSYDSGGFDDPYEDDYYGSDLGGFDDYDSYGSGYGSYYDDDDDDYY